MSKESSLSPEARSVLGAMVSRRGVLAGAGGLGAAGLLAACGGGSSSSAGDKNTVRWGNWPLYLDYDEKTKKYPTLEKFSKESGITAKYFEDYNDNDEFFGKVQAQLKLGEDIGYDVVTPTDWMAARWIRLGYTQKFDVANVPNKVNILDSLASPSFDPKREQSLTWQGIMAGFGWNTEKNPKGIHTLDELFAPQNKGKIVVLSEMRDTIGLILLAKGIDITSADSLTEDAFMDAIDFFAGKVADGQISKIKGNSYSEDLENGDTIAAIAWSGDTVQLNLSAKNEKYGFFIPESGTTISADCFVTPMGATHKRNVEELINYYYDPKVAAELAAWVNYVTPVVGAQEEAVKIDPELAKNQLIFPSEEFMKNAHGFRSLTGEESVKFSKAFQDVMLGA